MKHKFATLDLTVYESWLAYTNHGMVLVYESWIDHTNRGIVLNPVALFGSMFCVFAKGNTHKITRYHNRACAVTVTPPFQYRHGVQYTIAVYYTIGVQ